MHIWFGFAIARERDSLMKEAKPGHIYRIDSHDEFIKWVGWALCWCYDLYQRVVNGIDEAEDELAVKKVLLHPLWGDLKTYGWNQLQELRKIDEMSAAIAGVVIECGTDYHELIDLIDAAGIKMYEGKVRFVKCNENGLFKKAVKETLS